MTSAFQCYSQGDSTHQYMKSFCFVPRLLGPLREYLYYTETSPELESLVIDLLRLLVLQLMFASFLVVVII